MKTYSFYGMQPDGKRTEAYLHELANPIVVTPLRWPKFDKDAQAWRLLEFMAREAIANAFRTP